MTGATAATAAADGLEAIGRYPIIAFIVTLHNIDQIGVHEHYRLMFIRFRTPWIVCTSRLQIRQSCELPN